LLMHFAVGNGRSIAVGQTAEGVYLSLGWLQGMYCLISRGNGHLNSNYLPWVGHPLNTA